MEQKSICYHYELGTGEYLVTQKLSAYLRASNSKNHTHIIFKNQEHEEFYYSSLKNCRYQDSYHEALCYCLGISDDTRRNVNRIYDFKTGYIKTECLHDGWQTSGSLKIVRLSTMFLSPKSEETVQRNADKVQEENKIESGEEDAQKQTQSGEQGLEESDDLMEKNRQEKAEADEKEREK